YAGVETLGDDIGQAVVDDDLDLDVGIIPEEFGELRPQDRVDDIVDCRDPDGAGGPLAKVGYGIKLGADLLETRRHRLQEAFAGVRRRDAARGAREQPDAKARFELAHRAGERRLRH